MFFGLIAGLSVLFIAEAGLLEGKSISVSFCLVFCVGMFFWFKTGAAVVTLFFGDSTCLIGGAWRCPLDVRIRSNLL